VRSASWWTERPNGHLRIGVLLLVATTAIAVVVTYPRLLREGGDDAAKNSAQTYVDREVAGGNGLVADQQALYAARALIPPDATYHLAIAADYTGGDELTQGHVASCRPEERAPWVVCYGCDLADYGSAAEVLWRGDEDISIVRVGS
jgi:hypothetical protein